MAANTKTSVTKAHWDAVGGAWLLRLTAAPTPLSPTLLAAPWHMSQT